MSLVRGCPFFASNHSNIFDPFSLDHWDPFQRCPFIKSFASPVSIDESSPSPAFYARVDWKETPGAYVFKVDLPGMKKEEVEVKLEDGRVLHISGDRKREEGEKTDTWHRIERSIGSFLRRFKLPGSAKASDVKAAMEDGVLTVVVPKEEEKKRAEVKRIEISG
ncbi:17.6 kDa class I heat shock protein-like [Phalaenopsis equestris]|uniref:17.6 kDa class I heat shock protein-like n=1 Tax=Phalaenopsis equestris TaxID=78828 RepID=UPI0009E50932|nr:17.6 kDa class I heat shock protein-like [Phalaenopsis equestris]XP_020595814.1 17.6 kDa class I heat shock protein-like [Phalaenopsis equestris]